MSTLYEGVGSFTEEENINGLVIRHYDPEALALSTGSQWLSEYIAENARLEVMHTHREAVPCIKDESNNVWFAWSARTIPAQLPFIARNIVAVNDWQFSAQSPRMPIVKSTYERVQSGDIAVVASFSKKAETEGQPEIVLSYPLGAPGIAYLAEMLIDRTADQALLPHIPFILERERDLLI